MFFVPSLNSKTYIPFVFSPVCAGFPSPATDYIDRSLDLNEHIVKHPASTFYVRSSGDSMIGAGIHNGDILVVDRSLKAVSGNIIIAVLDGEFTVKRLSIKNEKVLLISENDLYQNISINDGIDFEIWGVVTTVIHSV
ncbi:MAG: translesion error-prone DNA polymerase V autoproteolytic subunit [Silvanigrellaceae bacterium]|nr:translesion error-prone DNA polymerase V autoproteolytic subunit [Silvanigrellaceae bacterium]